MSTRRKRSINQGIGNVPFNQKKVVADGKRLANQKAIPVTGEGRKNRIRGGKNKIRGGGV